MSERIHCDRCDAVIPKDITRLTLRCGTAKNDTFNTEQDERDYCRDCVEEIPLLKTIFAEQFLRDFMIRRQMEARGLSLR